MISLTFLVWIVVYLLIGLVILGLLWWLIGYIEAQGLGPPVAFKVLRIVFVVLVVLLCIGLLLSLINHEPLFRP